MEVGHHMADEKADDNGWYSLKISALLWQLSTVKIINDVSNQTSGWLKTNKRQ